MRANTFAVTESVIAAVLSVATISAIAIASHLRMSTYHKRDTRSINRPSPLSFVDEQITIKIICHNRRIGSNDDHDDDERNTTRRKQR